MRITVDPRKERLFKAMIDIESRQAKLMRRYEKTGKLGLIDEFLRLCREWQKRSDCIRGNMATL